MSAIIYKTGIQPHIRKELAQRDKALSGDIVMVISPATVAPAPTSEAWTREVLITIESADGELHDWLTASYSTKLSIADTSVAGTASIVSTTLSIVNGKAVVIVTGSEHNWLNSETDTLTVANITVLGQTVTGGTSVETFTA